MRVFFHAIYRALRVGLVLFPMWLAYVIPWIRARRFGAQIGEATWARKHQRHAARFYRLAVRMRGGLIKVGQILSARVDLLPVEWTSALSGLQDEVDPLPWSALQGALREAYGEDLDARFERIDEEALAAASFGQVHRARTKEGVEVALKVRYPGVERTLAIDISLMRIAVRLFNVFVPKISLAPIYEEISRALTTELDYAQEARFTREVHENFRDRPGVFIPEVVDDLTAEGVICTTFFEGLKITRPEVLEDPRLVRAKLLERLLETWIQMMYVDGVFQSDPHPGNLLVHIEAEGDFTLGVVDFGQVKILSRELHQKLVSSVMAFALGNHEAFVDSLVELGLFPASERDRFGPELVGLMKRLRDVRPEEGKELDFLAVRREIVQTLDRMEGVVIPQELVLYGRTFSILSGVARSIAPDDDALAIAKPLLTQALLAGGPPERART